MGVVLVSDIICTCLWGLCLCLTLSVRVYGVCACVLNYLYVSEIATHHVTRHNTPIHNILSTDPQLSISQKALGTFPDDGNVMPKHVGVTIHN
jgi:hypothetical protein